MKHYDYQKSMRALWEFAVKTYRDGNREPSSYFNDEQLQWMQENGLKVMDLYDFAEDFVTSDEPDFETFLLVSTVRREYFQQEQKGKLSNRELDMDSLPSKEDAVDGIEWLPRILPKARAKLLGELPPELMYGCGGDRKFFKANDIHPAEFLRVVWAYFDDDKKVVEWVKNRVSE